MSKANYKKLGNYITDVNERNSDLSVETLLGVSIRKVLMPSIANTIGTNMKTYKIIRKNQFIYGSVTSRNGDKISIALLEDYNEAIVSQAYTVFKIIDEEKLLPEYLMMWFRRPEFDRYARYKSHGSAREIFNWDELLEVELPIPSINKQKEIVKEYKTVTNRIKLNEQLNKKLEETAQTIYKHWFVDFEFPNEDGNPYKSNDGEMVYNEELDKDIPVGWEVVELRDIVDVIDNRGKTPPNGTSHTDYPLIEVNSIGNKTRVINYSSIKKYVTKEIFETFFRGKPKKYDTLIATVGANIGVMSMYVRDLGNVAQNIIVLSAKKITSLYLYQTLLNNTNSLKRLNIGGAQPSIKVPHILSIKITCPNTTLLKFFDNYIIEIVNKLDSNQKQNQELEKLKDLLLSRMSKN